MEKDDNRDHVIVRISIDENGVPRVKPLSAKEQKRFTKSHPNLQLPTLSLSEVQRGLEELERELTHPTSPSPANQPSAVNIVPSDR
jgi:hypothetical protein